jgi:hypothetical protein
VGGGEQSAHRTALGDPEQRRAVAPGGVHHRMQVARRLLEGGRATETVGQALPSLVVDDQASEGGEAPQHAGGRGLLPEQLEVRDEAGDEHQVEVSLAMDLVGDADAVRVGVVGLRFHRCGEGL